VALEAIDRSVISDRLIAVIMNPAETPAVPPPANRATLPPAAPPPDGTPKAPAAQTAPRDVAATVTNVAARTPALAKPVEISVLLAAVADVVAARSR
jgi:hypothetical protein